MDLGIAGKVAVVTGASRGIGKGIARALANEGCHLTICAREQHALETTAREIRELGVKVLAIPCDVTQAGIAEQVVQATADAHGRLDILVNNVGGNNRTPFPEQTDAEWEQVINLNLLAGVRMTRAALPHFQAAGGGSVVFITSIWGRERGGTPVYVSTKAAAIGLAASLARELAPLHIRVNSIAPGSIRFPGGSWDRRVQQDPEGMAEFVRRELPFGRFGTVEEVADVVAFVVSPRANWITGACIPVDGGQSRSLI